VAVVVEWKKKGKTNDTTPKNKFKEKKSKIGTFGKKKGEVRGKSATCKTRGGKEIEAMCSYWFPHLLVKKDGPGL